MSTGHIFETGRVKKFPQWWYTTAATFVQKFFVLLVAKMREARRMEEIDGLLSVRARKAI